MLRVLKKALLGIAGGLLALGATSAHAQITVTLPNPVPIQTPGYSPGYDQFNYELTTDGSTYLTAGDSFQIADISGLFNALAPTNFTAADDLSLGDVTFTYTGPTTGTSLAITGFLINTAPGYDAVAPGEWDATGTSAGVAVDNSGVVAVPALGAAAPLPPAAYAFPAALLLAAFAYRKLNRLT